MVDNIDETYAFDFPGKDEIKRFLEHHRTVLFSPQKIKNKVFNERKKRKELLAKRMANLKNWRVWLTRMCDGGIRVQHGRDQGVRCSGQFIIMAVVARLLLCRHRPASTAPPDPVPRGHHHHPHDLSTWYNRLMLLGSFWSRNCLWLLGEWLPPQSWPSERTQQVLILFQKLSFWSSKACDLPLGIGSLGGRLSESQSHVFYIASKFTYFASKLPVVYWLVHSG